MKLPFRKYHILQILNQFLQSSYPLDLFLRFYFKKFTSIGSKDRKEVAETIYKIFRFKGLIDYFIPSPITNEKRINVFETLDFDKETQNPDIPSHVRASFPKIYFDKLKSCYGEEKALDLCKISNTQAPTTIRVNALKTQRDSLFDILSKNYKVYKTKSAHGLTFKEKINFFSTQEFKDGLFEIQDEGSQMIADFIPIREKDHVLDYCAGAGGKTLAFAHKLNGKGQIYLHDIRLHILTEAKKRLKRAGIENFQLVDKRKLKKLKNKMDLVVLDVPCSGSGTLRRNPDMKWRFSLEMLQKLILEQKKIFEEALIYLKPDGKIVYITCSIFNDENEEQIDYFLKKYNLKVLSSFKTHPQKDLYDGFFMAILIK